jgi:Protein of unknown function (DUF2934)
MNDVMRKKIEQRAYEIYLKRGKAPGNAKSDWEKAEREILAEVNSAKQSPVVKEPAAPAPTPKPAAAPAQTNKPTPAKKPPQQKRK